MKKRNLIIASISILMITFIAFIPSLNNGFTNWDDPVNVLENAKIKELSWRSITNIFTSRRPNDFYKPLTELSFALEYYLFGLNPGFYHTTNLLFHLLNCLLVFWLILLLSNSSGISFITALLFGIHPLHVESVAWITQRKDVLYSFFFLGSLIAYLIYRRKRVGKVYYISLALFLFSLLTKPQGILLPFVLLLFDYFSGRKFNRKTFLEKAPFLLISIMFVLVSITALGALASDDAVREKLSIGIPSFLNAGFALVFYLFKLAIPINLSCFYPYSFTIAGESLPWFLLSPFIIAALTMMVIYSGRYSRKVIFGCLFFLFNVVLILQAVPTRSAIIADHYAYISSIGLFYLVGLSIQWLYDRKFRYSKLIRTFLMAATVVMTVYLILLTRQRCRMWKDSLTLWYDALQKYPKISQAHCNLADAFYKRGQFEIAVSHCHQALKIRPHDAEAHHNLGLNLAMQGEFDRAIAQFSEAIRIRPYYPEAHNNLGNALEYQGELDEAIAHYTEAIRINPDFADAHANLGDALAYQGKLDEAINHYIEAIRIKPDRAKEHNMLGHLLAGQGKLDEAIIQFAEVIRIKPNNEKAHYQLGNALAEEGRMAEAIRQYFAAVRIKPDYADAHVNLGNALAYQGRLDEAVAHYSRALNIKPDCATTHGNLGYLLVRQGKLDEAIAHYYQALRIKPDYTDIRRKLKKALRQAGRDNDAARISAGP